VANVLGAFSLGLIFHPAAKIEFDRSAKIYTALLLGLTTAFAALAAFLIPMGRTVGWILVATFAVYIVGIGYGIYRGAMAPLDNDDDNSNSDSDSDSDATDDDHDVEKKPRYSAEHDDPSALIYVEPTSNESFLPAESAPTANVKATKWLKHSLAYHVAYLILGFAALSISGYILSHSASTVGEELGMSETVLGLTVLSFATTLPEKLVAIMSGARGHGGIVVANTAGSNIFLLTLCAGFLFLTTADFEELVSSVKVFDVATLWLSSLVLFLIIFFGARRWMGVGLFIVYIGFVVLEFAM
jgi:Ca2+/Na+ antiporter